MNTAARLRLVAALRFDAMSPMDMYNADPAYYREVQARVPTGRGGSGRTKAMLRLPAGLRGPGMAALLGGSAIAAGLTERARRKGKQPDVMASRLATHRHAQNRKRRAAEGDSEDAVGPKPRPDKQRMPLAQMLTGGLATAGGAGLGAELAQRLGRGRAGRLAGGLAGGLGVLGLAAGVRHKARQQSGRRTNSTDTASRRAARLNQRANRMLAKPNISRGGAAAAGGLGGAIGGAIAGGKRGRVGGAVIGGLGGLVGGGASRGTHARARRMQARARKISAR